MAVQAQNPSTTLPDHLRNRPVQLSSLDFASIDPRSFTLPFSHANLAQLSLPGALSTIDGQEMIPPPAGTSILAMQNSVLLNNRPQSLPQQAPIAFYPSSQVSGQRKRRKSSTDKKMTQIPQISRQQISANSLLAVNQMVDLNHIHSCPPNNSMEQHGLVSTGLRLTFDDDRSTVTSSRLMDARSTVGNDEFSAQLIQQSDEIKQILQIQTDQLKRAIDERTQLHSKALLASVEEEVARRLQERDAELERISKKAMELEERAKHLTMETNVWQSKARSYESMVTVLRSKLQQALLVHNQSREQSKLEGCGDSETDDAASVYIDNNAEAQQTRAMMMMKKGMMGGDLLRNSSSSSSARCCRKCRMKEASLLVLPCLHLCLCNECNASTDRCPVCNSVKTAYVEVYLC